MTNEQMIAWLREEAKLSDYRAEEELFNLTADRIEALQADNARQRKAIWSAEHALCKNRLGLCLSRLREALQETG